MQLSWLMRLRIAAAAATGAVLIGVLAWPLAALPNPFVPVSLAAGTINFADAITLAALALVTGFVAYFLSWPYGREIAILAVPSGLAIWAARCGDMASLIRSNPTLSQRQALLAALKWEPFFWLIIVAAGFAGLLLAQKISQKKASFTETQEKDNSKSNMYLNAAIALVASIFIVQICLSIFARDVRIFDSQLGSLVGQPAIGQIVFAVVVSFGIAAFAVKKFLNVSYIWPIIATALITPFTIITYLKQDVLQLLVQRCPEVFFPHPAISILPVQMVAFGTLGSIAGYWLAVRVNFRRKQT
jgi:hypothetical protein